MLQVLKFELLNFRICHVLFQLFYLQILKVILMLIQLVQGLLRLFLNSGLLADFPQKVSLKILNKTFVIVSLV